MAEVFGIVGAAVGVAAEGLKLSQTLYEFVENVRLADTDIKKVADDVSSTVVVLQQFEASLKLDEESMICTREFYKVTSENIDGCSAVFASIDKALQKSIRAMKDAPTAGSSFDQGFELRKWDKFLWPFNKPRVENLRRDLDRLKINLNLKMQVMAHAREIHERQKALRATENDEKIKALRIEALALEAQEAERKYQEIKTRFDETQAWLQKEPLKGETAIDKQLRRTSIDSHGEQSQDFGGKGQGSDLEVSFQDSPSPKRKHAAGKQLDENMGQNDSFLSFSKIEVLLGRIAGAQEAIVLATGKQGPPIRLAGSTSSDSEPSQQSKSVTKGQVTQDAHEEDLHQNVREPGNKHRRPILDDRPLDRIARVQERLAGLTELPSVSHTDPLSPRNESKIPVDDFISYTPKEDDESLEITERSNEPVDGGEDAVQSITNGPSTKKGTNDDLKVASETDRSTCEAEPNNVGGAGSMISTSGNNANDWPNLISGRHLKSKGKEKQNILEQMNHKPRLFTGFAKNPTPIKTIADARVEWAQRLTASTGALVLYTNSSTWVHGLMNDSASSFDKRQQGLKSPDSTPLSKSSVTGKGSASPTADALKSPPPALTLNDTLENLANVQMAAGSSFDRNERRQSPMTEEVKQEERREHQFLGETSQQNELRENNRSQDSITGDTGPPHQEVTSHNEANGETESPISNGQFRLLSGPGTGDDEDSEDSGIERNNEIVDATDNRNLTSPKPLGTVSDAPVITADNVQSSNRQGSETGAGASTAAAANDQDIGVGPGENQSGSPKPDSSYSRVARPRASLLRRFIFRHQNSRTVNNDGDNDDASTTRAKRDRIGKRRTYVLRLNRWLAELIRPKTSKRESSRFRRSVKTWFFKSRRLSSSSISRRSYTDTSSSSYYTYSEDEERANPIAVMEPTPDENSPKPGSGEGTSILRSRIENRTILPPASQKLKSGKNHRRDSQRQVKSQNPPKPSKIADERATEYVATNRTSLPHERVLDITEVVDLDQPSTFVPVGCVSSHEKHILEAWLLRPADPMPGQSRTWKRARRIFIPLGAEELEAEVEKFDRKTQTRHSKPLWTIIRSLSSDQQQHIEQLLEMKRACDKDQRFHWTLVALKVGPGASLKPYDSVYIQVIIKRHLDSNTLRKPIGPSRMASASRLLPYSNQNITGGLPKPPRRSSTRPNYTTRPHRYFYNDSSSSDSVASSYRSRDMSADESLSSSDKERSGTKRAGRLSSNKGLFLLRQKRRAEQEERRTVDRRSRTRGDLGHRGKENRETDFKHPAGLGKVNSKIADLEIMLQDLEGRLEELRTEGSRTGRIRQRSFERLRRRSESEDDDWLDYGQNSRELPKQKHRFLRLQPPPESSIDQLQNELFKERNALNLSRASPHERRSYGPSSSYLRAHSRAHLESDDDWKTRYNPRDPASSSLANETRTSRYREEVDDDSRDRKAKPVVRFEEHKPSKSQDLGAGVASSASNDQSLGLTGPLVYAASSQLKPPSPIAPTTSLSPLSPTVTSLIAKWTTLKPDNLKEKKQPGEAMGIPIRQGDKGDEESPTPQKTKAQEPLRHDEGLTYSSMPAPPRLPPVTAAEHDRAAFSNYDPPQYFPYSSSQPPPLPPSSSYNPVSSIHPSQIPTSSSYPHPDPHPRLRRVETLPSDPPNSNTHAQAQAQAQAQPPPPIIRLDNRRDANRTCQTSTVPEPSTRWERERERADGQSGREREQGRERKREQGRGREREQMPGRIERRDEEDETIPRRKEGNVSGKARGEDEDDDDIIIRRKGGNASGKARDEDEDEDGTVLEREEERRRRRRNRSYFFT